MHPGAQAARAALAAGAATDRVEIRDKYKNYDPDNLLTSLIHMLNVGGFLASLIGMQGSTGLIGSIVVAFVGACVMIALVRAIAPRRAI